MVEVIDKVRGLPGPALLAHVPVAKFADHLPLYRQSMVYAREGVALDCGQTSDAALSFAAAPSFAASACSTRCLLALPQ